MSLCCVMCGDKQEENLELLCCMKGSLICYCCFYLSGNFNTRTVCQVCHNQIGKKYYILRQWAKQLYSVANQYQSGFHAPPLFSPYNQYEYHQIYPPSYYNNNIPNQFASIPYCHQRINPVMSQNYKPQIQQYQNYQHYHIPQQPQNFEQPQNFQHHQPKNYQYPPNFSQSQVKNSQNQMQFQNMQNQCPSHQFFNDNYQSTNMKTSMQSKLKLETTFDNRDQIQNIMEIHSNQRKAKDARYLTPERNNQNSVYNRQRGDTRDMRRSTSALSFGNKNNTNMPNQ